MVPDRPYRRPVTRVDDRFLTDPAGIFCPGLRTRLFLTASHGGGVPDAVLAPNERCACKTRVVVQSRSWGNWP